MTGASSRLRKDDEEDHRSILEDVKRLLGGSPETLAKITARSPKIAMQAAHDAKRQRK